MKEKVFTWLYRIFTMIVPGGVVLWTFFIEKMISSDVSVMNKIGIAGVVALCIAVLLAVYLVKRILNKKITDKTNECIECVDNEQKAKLVAEKKKLEAKKEIFHNLCFLAPFVIVWLVLTFVEKGVVSLRGTMLIVCISMAVGLGFDVIAEWLKSKGNKNETSAKNTSEDK